MAHVETPHGTCPAEASVCTHQKSCWWPSTDAIANRPRVAPQSGPRPHLRHLCLPTFLSIQYREIVWRSDWTAHLRTCQRKSKSEKRSLREAEWFSFFSSAPSRAGVEGCLALVGSGFVSTTFLFQGL